MKRGLGLCVGLGLLLAGSVAFAQEDVQIGYAGLPYKGSGESNTGVQIGEGTLLHVGVGAEAGYDTNVFYANTDPKGSGIIRVLPYAEITNATRNGPTSNALTFDLRGGFQYRHYTSSDSDVQKYSDAWNPSAGASLSFGGGQVGFGIADVFARIEDPPYAGQMGIVAATILERNNNQASAEVRWSPGGGRLTGTLRYTNMVDVFGASYQYANSVTNSLMLDVAWKWLPKTAIFFNAQQGYIDYFDNTSSKSNSFPLSLTVGVRGLLTEKTSAVLAVGYANGFYQSGGSTSGFLGNSYANLAVTVRPTQLSRVVVGARHDFINSVISNFAYQDAVYLSYIQQIAGRLALDLSGRYAHLDYGGAVVDPVQAGRVDNFVMVGATLDYFLRNWAYLGAGYSLLDNSSNITIATYVKQQVFARLGFTY